MLSGFYLVNEASGKVLDDPGGSTSNGAVIDQWQLNGGTNQRWDFVGADRTANNLIVNEASNKVLERPLLPRPTTGPSSASTRCNGGGNQRVEVRHVDRTATMIVNAFSNKVLDDPIPPPATAPRSSQWQSERGSLTSSGRCWRWVTAPP